MSETTSEEVLWEGHPSHAMYFGTYLICGLLCWLIVPIFIIIYKYLEIKGVLYTLTSERLRIRTGILNHRTEEIELYRIRDYSVEKPFFLRLFGVGNIRLLTSDKTEGDLTLQAVPDPESLRDLLRNNVEKCRVKKRVREVDFE